MEDRLAMRQRQPDPASVIISAVAAIVLTLSGPVSLTAYACDVPVYQYALENWEADQYEVTVFHRGPLSEAEREAVGLLRGAADHREGHGNLAVRTVDLNADPDAITLQRWREQGGDELPWVVAAYPPVKRLPDPAWTGPLTEANAQSLLASPLRRKVASELTGRVTAVWMLLESGNRGKDNAAAALLERELRRLEETLVLPTLEAWGPDGGEIEPQPVRFTMHRLSREAPREQMLVDMLLHSESDLATKYASEPMVFPIYGRGLILYALVGAGINEWTIMKAAEFVTGPCSCEVKAGNPGTDMLLTLDWNALVKQTVQERMPPPSGMASFPERAAEAERRLAEVDAARDAGVAVVSDPAAGPVDGGLSAAPARSTAPRTMATTAAAPPVNAESAAEAGTPLTRENSQEPVTEEAGSAPADSTAASETQGEAPVMADEETQSNDEPEDSAPLAQHDAEGDDDGVARMVALLALVAAVITAALGAAVVLRRRRNAVRDEDHERVPT